MQAGRILFHGVLKMMMTVIFLTLSIVVIGVEPLAFFLTFGLMQLSYLAGGSPKVSS